MSQASKILEMLKSSPSGVTCQDLAFKGLYHHASQRIGEIKRQYNLNIIFQSSHTEDPMQARYILMGDELPLGDDIQKLVGPW